MDFLNICFYCKVKKVLKEIIATFQVLEWSGYKIKKTNDMFVVCGHKPLYSYREENVPDVICRVIDLVKSYGRRDLGFCYIYYGDKFSVNSDRTYTYFKSRYAIRFVHKGGSSTAYFDSLEDIHKRLAKFIKTEKVNAPIDEILTAEDILATYSLEDIIESVTRNGFIFEEFIPNYPGLEDLEAYYDQWKIQQTINEIEPPYEDEYAPWEAEHGLKKAMDILAYIEIDPDEEYAPEIREQAKAVGKALTKLIHNF